MTHDESWYKTKLVKEGRQFGDYARRIEDKFSVGMPDILYRVKDGSAILIEAKMITGPTFGPEPRQLIELERWYRAGGLGLMLGFADDAYYLSYVCDPVQVKNCVVSDPGETFPLFIRRFLK